MAQVTLVGTVNTDLEVKMDSKNRPYVRFDVVEQIGSRMNRRTQTFTVCAFGSDAERLSRDGVQVGMEISLSGTLELEDYSVSGGRYKAVRMKVYMSDWCFTSVAKVNESYQIPILDGEREELPE